MSLNIYKSTNKKDGKYSAIASNPFEHALEIQRSLELSGSVNLVGAKNAVLVIMASCILTNGVSILHNVPYSHDVLQMIILLQDLGAIIFFDQKSHQLTIDTTALNNFKVRPEIMQKMRASILVMGPLLTRFSKADIALPGGCLIGKRPIDLHLKNFEKLGIKVQIEGNFITALAKKIKPCRIVLEYPSVGATENILMAAVAAEGTTEIINAALEPEVLDLIVVLKKMGADIIALSPSTLIVTGVSSFAPIEHEILVDRLEAGSLLLATAITGGNIEIPNVNHQHLDVFLLKLEEMGHEIDRGLNGKGLKLQSSKNPQAVSFTTAPYPGFPTDLQAPMMVAQTIAKGKSIIHEAVFENRLLHVRELQKMGAQISIEGDRAVVTGVDELFGTHVIASDIRASCALALAGLVAKGKTIMTGLQHWYRGYEHLEKKLMLLGADISLKTTSQIS